MIYIHGSHEAKAEGLLVIFYYPMPRPIKVLQLCARPLELSIIYSHVELPHFFIYIFFLHEGTGNIFSYLIHAFYSMKA
jgi:hypothetical protein